MIFKFFKKKSKQVEPDDDMKYLIIGLGNPGETYAETRHNIGFKVLDAFTEASDIFFEHARYADVAKVKYKGKTFVLVKPMTFMNLSGKAVDYWMKKEHVELDKTLIIVDDLALSFGTIRLKDNGGDGGHNGLKDIIEVLGHQNFNRLRFGIGNNFSRGRQVDFVLDRWSEEESKLLPERLGKMIGAVKNFATIGMERTMNFFNSKYDFEEELKKFNQKEHE
jgi:PTH1 family peptidyl-tRNA hydrolase